MGAAAFGALEPHRKVDVTEDCGKLALDKDGELSILSIETKEGSHPGSILARSAKGSSKVETVFDVGEGVVRLTAGGFHGVILNACIEDDDARVALRMLRESAPGLPVVLVCDRHKRGEHLGVQGIRLGAQECLASEDLEPDRLFTALVQAVERNCLIQRERWLSFDLEKAVFHRTRQLEEVNSELEAFNYMVSHDLRARLCAIMGLSRLLKEEHQHVLGTVPLLLLERIMKAGLAMEGLLEALLSLGRAGKAVIDTSPVSLSALVNEAFEELSSRFPHRKVDGVVQEDVWVEGDPVLLKLLIDNLVGNAWKFTASRPSARIEFGRRMDEERRVYFVRDDGPGFDPADASLLFKPFWRLDRSVEGFGVGLATVERVVRRHGGEVWAEGSRKEGAAFYFTLAPCPTM